MIRSTFIFASLFCSVFAFSQEEILEEDENKFPEEIGIDGYFGAGSFGGSFGVGLKYAIVRKESPQLAFGSSFRLQRTWSNNQQTNQTFGFNIIGFGGFAHVRFYEVLFLGAEIEFMNSPQLYNVPNPPKSWIPTAFLGGGYSQLLTEKARLNLGVYYDVIDHDF